jgi:hypothetical protein
MRLTFLPRVFQTSQSHTHYVFSVPTLPRGGRTHEKKIRLPFLILFLKKRRVEKRTLEIAIGTPLKIKKMVVVVAAHPPNKWLPFCVCVCKLTPTTFKMWKPLDAILV